jgi:hypothetical protein
MPPRLYPTTPRVAVGVENGGAGQGLVLAAAQARRDAARRGERGRGHGRELTTYLIPYPVTSSESDIVIHQNPLNRLWILENGFQA